jgi:hypothetical protein
MMAPAKKAPNSARASLGAILSGAPGTYIEQLLADRDSTIERWPDHTNRPLLVWIDSSDCIGGAQAGFRRPCAPRFPQWAADGHPAPLCVRAVRFATLTFACTWTDHLDHKTGSTTWRTDRIGWLITGDITLATHISDGQALDAAACAPSRCTRSDMRSGLSIVTTVTILWLRWCVWMD